MYVTWQNYASFRLYKTKATKLYDVSLFVHSTDNNKYRVKNSQKFPSEMTDNSRLAGSVKIKITKSYITVLIVLKLLS